MIASRVVLAALALACCTKAPAGPCLSDRECRADRICHEGRCRFLEAVRTELAASGPSGLGPGPEPTQEVGDVGSPGAGQEPPSEHAGGVGQFMGDARHTGRVPFRGPTRAVREAWSYRTQARVYASPVLGPSDTVIFGSLDKSLTAVDVHSGALRFRFSATSKLYASAAVTHDGTIFAGSDDGTLFALTAEGQLRFERKLGDGINASLVATRDRVYVAADGLYALDLGGRVLWHLPLGVHVRSAPAVHPKGLVLVGTPAGTLLAVTLQGEKAWEAHAGANIDGGPAVADDGRILFGTDLGHVICLDADGRELWRFETGADVRATPAIMSDGTAVVGSYDRFLYAIHPDGTLRFRVETAGRIRSSARVDPDDNLYFGSQDDFVYGISREGEVLFRHNIGRDVDSSPVIDASGTLLIGADDGAVYALKET